VVDETTDGRRKVALKRKQQEWDDDRVLLAQIVDTLRDSDEKNVTQLVNVIRSNASSEDIKLCIDGQRREAYGSSSASPGLAELYHGVAQRDGSSRRAVMDMHRLVDSPFLSVTAEPWTTVTDDNHLVSHLVSLWFTWSAPWQNWIDRNLFVRDMQSRNLNVEYCSPFLVNAMLAHACVSPSPYHTERSTLQSHEVNR
jgi:hypothetical protein